ncbi:hypothetical protein LWL40_27675 (plasmid) [Bacillus thuringiensis]|uniref:hypothetical protein n=1 Tax=Bacillus thuringiensis TaxID=1428 RepID=UPI003D717C51
MEQMTLFDIPATTVTATQPLFTQLEERALATQHPTKEEPIFETIANAEPIEVNRSVVPTWQVNFFDKDRRERLEWYQCEDEEDARKEVTKEYPNLLSIVSVEESRYSIEEIRAMD